MKGVYYRSFAYYLGAEKKINDQHRIAFMAMASPGQRGAQNASTQEVYDLMGDNMYNSNWGYQNGRVRNSRVRITHEPIFVVKYTATPLDNFETNVALLWRTGKNGYTALDWYDAADPRADYYRNLPSYFYNEDSNWGRNNQDKAFLTAEAWAVDPQTQHLDWDRLYNVNYNAEGGRSRYILEERRTDQNDFNVAANFKWDARSWFTLNGGLNAKINRTEYYKIVNDLLGGEYFLNTDNFSERDFAFSKEMIQNDLDYYLENGQAQQLSKGDKYGYDYYAQVRNADVWADARFNVGNFKANVGAKLGVSSFWREGLLRKGIFAGLDDEGNPYVVKDLNGNDVSISPVDENGNYITSKGKSAVSTFFTYALKAHGEYVFTGGHRVYANLGWFSDAPKFNQAFLSPRTRNSLVPDLKNVNTVSADINWQYSNNGYDVRVTGFLTQIMNQTDLMSFYDDSYNSFTNFALSGIDERHMGIELGFKLPLGVKGLSLQGALSWGQYIYTSTPKIYQTIDNSSEVVLNGEIVPYWASSPVYKLRSNLSIDEQEQLLKSTIAPEACFEQDEMGNYVVEKVQKHHVPSTPQLAANLALNYRTNSYWFFTLGANVYAFSYLDMNPLYRTHLACGGGDGIETPSEVEYMAAQEKFGPAFLLNGSIGKSWQIKRTYTIGFSLEASNMLNNRNVKTGGSEQTRLISSYGKDRYYRFAPKYFYMSGASYMLNIYFRF